MSDIVDGGNAFSFGDPLFGAHGTVKWVFEDYWQGQSKTTTFFSTDTAVDFVVPDTVSLLQATLRGGAGGGENIDNVAQGGHLVVQFPVTPGETLRIRVGGDGSRATPGLTGASGAFNGGGDGGTCTTAPHTGGYGGGGASDIRQGGDALADRIAIAAGAGGNSGEGISFRGGAGGVDTGETGESPAGPQPLHLVDYYAGFGGSQIAGGAGGIGTGSPANSGGLGVGGDGQDRAFAGGGGGGGGFFGGGGGGSAVSGPGSAGGGGGGSNGVGAGVTVVANGRGVDKSINTDWPLISLEFTETADRYVWEINPNDGGSPQLEKNIVISQSVGPNRLNLVQEGQSKVPILTFSGVILTQRHYEVMEQWFDRRVLIKLTDDLGRQFFGVFSKFAPKRQRRAHDVWYHTYDGEFTATAYITASGASIYGRVG